jgi:hypothetical protein
MCPLRLRHGLAIGRQLRYRLPLRRRS